MAVGKGHHIYKTYWMPVVGEELTLETEDDNEHDEHAVATMKMAHCWARATLNVQGILVFYEA